MFLFILYFYFINKFVMFCCVLIIKSIFFLNIKKVKVKLEMCYKLNKIINFSCFGIKIC